MAEGRCNLIVWHKTEELEFFSQDLYNIPSEYWKTEFTRMMGAGRGVARVDF